MQDLNRLKTEAKVKNLFIVAKNDFYLLYRKGVDIYTPNGLVKKTKNLEVLARTIKNY